MSKKRELLVRIFVLLIVAILYLAVIAVVPLPDWFLLFPTTNRINSGTATQKMLPFDGGSLEVWTAASRMARQRGQAEWYILRQHMVLDAYAGEKRVIPLAGASHNSPIEGIGLTQFYHDLDWLMPINPN